MSPFDGVRSCGEAAALETDFGSVVGVATVVGAGKPRMGPERRQRAAGVMAGAEHHVPSHKTGGSRVHIRSHVIVALEGFRLPLIFC